MKGTSFSGCVCYVLKEDKSRLLEAVGVTGTPEQMASDFELQTLLNDKVKNTVGHISLSFMKEDGARIKVDDVYMLGIARDYMERMGIKNTQYLVARHTDREHPHLHIVFNRVDNNGKTISDKNDRFRNEKVCKMITSKYRLHFSDGKQNIKEERLRHYDRARHEVFKALKSEVAKAKSWDSLKERLADRGIDLMFKVSRTDREIQGVKFSYGNYTFSGSKVDRAFSYANINHRLTENASINSFEQSVSGIYSKEDIRQEASHSYQTDNTIGIGLGLLNGFNSNNASDIEANQEMSEIERRKRAKRKRGMRL